jgi:Flp pilus assembly protein TadD
VHNNTTFRLDAGVPTLATFFKRAGYRTGAFVGAFVLDARFGLAHDFDVYDDHLPRRDAASFHFSERRAKEVFDAALAWISAPRTLNPARWLAWVHLFDPHAPYAAPAEFRAGRSDYDAEVAYTDAMLGAFLDRLRASGQLEHTLIVATADHGESLGEHGETTHGLFAYESTLAVPLIVNATGITPAVIDGDVAHVDIVPTILDLAGLPMPSGLDGVSLLHPAPADRAVYFEALDAYLTRGWAPLRGLVQAGWKYIDLPDAELYDLKSDPGETRNRIGQDARADLLQKRLSALESEQLVAPVPAALDAEAEARLRSLGYVGRVSTPKAAAVGTRGGSRADDPKHLVALNEQFNSALTAFEEGRAEEALGAFAAVLRSRPDFLTARTSAATTLIARNRAADAVRLLRDAPADQAASPELLAKLGGALRSAGDFTAAAAALERARAAGDRSVDVLQDLAIVYAQLDRRDAARELFEELTAANPTSATAWFNLGLFQLQNDQPAAAANALRKAVERDPQYGDAWNALGAALAGSSPVAAIEAWRRAEPLLPRDYDLLFNLAMLTAQSDRPREAIPYLRRFLAEAPRGRYARDLPRVQDVLNRVEQPR